jgi:hypothetical protein
VFSKLSLTTCTLSIVIQSNFQKTIGINFLDFQNEYDGKKALQRCSYQPAENMTHAEETVNFISREYIEIYVFIFILDFRPPYDYAATYLQ